MGRSEIWIPGEDNLKNYLPSPEETDKKVTLRVTIRYAAYDPEAYQGRGALSLTVLLPDGTVRNVPQPLSAYARAGVRMDHLPRKEADREMEKLAEAYRKARGRPINLDIYEHLM